MTNQTIIERELVFHSVADNPREGALLTSELRDRGEVQVLRHRPEPRFIWFRTRQGYWVTKPEYGWYNWMLTRKSRRRLKKVIASTVDRYGEAIFLSP